MKDCYRCREKQTLESFYNDKSRRDGKNALCKKCCVYSVMKCYWRNPEAKKEYIKKWQLAHPDQRYLAAWRSGLKKYGITPEGYYSIFEKQEGKCAICFTEKPGAKKSKFTVDHCHKTGKVRGLLCQACNKALGGFMDSTEFLGSAIKYIIKSTNY